MWYSAAIDAQERGILPWHAPTRAPAATAPHQIQARAFTPRSRYLADNETFTLGVATAEANAIEQAIRHIATADNTSRADALIRLITGASNTQIVVNLYAPVTPAAATATTAGDWSAARLATTPGAIDTTNVTVGSAPVTPQHSEKLLASATHARHVSPARSAGYTPTAAQAAFVRGRDRVCRHPGCTVPAERCDIDPLRPRAARPGWPDRYREAAPAVPSASPPRKAH